VTEVSKPSAPAPLRIAIVGAESTGKTTLARELAVALAEGPSQRLDAPRPAARVALVPEFLREWCVAHGRTPRPDEQAAILAEQHARIDAASAAHDIVVADTTALMTHVYSELLFGDRSLIDTAIAQHRTMAATLLTALDLPWVPDPAVRDGEHVRRPVDDLLRALLLQHRLPFAVVSGRGPARLAQALAALRPAMGAGRSRRSALFSTLTAGAPADARPVRRWLCECCDPAAERAVARARSR